MHVIPRICCVLLTFKRSLSVNQPLQPTQASSRSHEAFIFEAASENAVLWPLQPLKTVQNKNTSHFHTIFLRPHESKFLSYDF